MSGPCTAVEWREELTVPESATVVVNATSLGLPGSADVPLSFDSIPANLVVCDVIPNPPDTTFLQRARKAGARRWTVRKCTEARAINIELWTGIDPDREVMGSALDRRLSAGSTRNAMSGLVRDRRRRSQGATAASAGGFRRCGRRFTARGSPSFPRLVARTGGRRGLPGRLPSLGAAVLARPESRAEAHNPELAARQRHAVFMTGGNQLKLSTFMIGTPFADAIHAAYPAVPRWAARRPGPASWLIT